MKVLITDFFSANALTRLRNQKNLKISHADGHQPTKEELQETDILLTRSRTKITQTQLEQAPKLQLIVSATSGCDHIDLEACHQRNIQVLTTPDANAQSTAELTILLMLAHLRKLPLAIKKMSKTQWRDAELRGHTLAGKRLGIIGLGRIGSKVAKLAQAFGVEVTACDPYLTDDVFYRLGVERLSLSEVLISSDIITLHVPLTQETYHMINRQTLATMNPEALLINASRGPVIDEGELALALSERRLRGAALDVFEREPLIKEAKINAAPHTLLTPHLGAYTLEALEGASMEAVSHVLRAIQACKTPGEDYDPPSPLRR